MKAKNRIIVDLDIKNFDESKSLVEALAPHVGYFKVDIELLTAVGSRTVVNFIHSCGGKIFYDGKFNDNPNKIGAATKAVSDMNVKMFSIHASSGIEAMIAAVINKGQSLVFAVTVLSSIKSSEAKYIFGSPTKEKILQFTRDAVDAGCDGVVCSPEELRILSTNEDTKDLLKITENIRPKWATYNDYKLVITPSEAVKAGATFLVIDRPITKPSSEIGSPVNAAQKIAEEISTAL